MEKMRHPVTGHPRYMASMEFVELDDDKAVISSTSFWLAVDLMCAMSKFKLTTKSNWYRMFKMFVSTNK
jgi:hypothetical protein